MDTAFFIGSKLFEALIDPASLLLIWIGVGIGRLRNGYGAGVALSGLLAFVMVGGLPLGNLLLKPLEQRFPARPEVEHVAGIIVLGGGENARLSEASGQPEVNEAGDRFFAAIMLARRYPRAPVLFTGGSGDLVPGHLMGGDVASSLLLGMGLEPGRLFIEKRSRTTAENAAMLRAAWEARPHPRHVKGQWLLVTTASHMPRAVGAFCQAGWRDLVPWPVDYRTTDFAEGIGWDPAGHLRALDLGIKEWVGMAGYAATHRSSALMPAGC